MAQADLAETSIESVIAENVDGYLTCTRRLDVIKANNKARELLGLTNQKTSAIKLESALSANTIAAINHSLVQLSAKKSLRIESFDDIHNKWFELILYPHDELITLCLRDITALKQTYHSLQESELRLRTMLESVIDGVILIDEQGTILLCNHVIESLFGYHTSELIGRNISMLMNRNQRFEHDGYIKNFLKTGKAKIIGIGREVTGQRRDTTTFPLELGVSHFSLDGRRYFVGTMRDVTQRRENENEIKLRNQQLQSVNRRLEQLAMHDHLTGLPNRSLFLKKLQNCLHSADLTDQSLILLMLDLDNFKEINDTLGHNIGDELLKRVSQRLRNVLRTSDPLARLGGDEFGIILMRATPEGAAIVANNILQSLEPLFEVEKHQLSVKASIGISIYREHGDNEASLLKNADVAMYEAKRNHVGYAFYDATSDNHNPDNLSLLSQLRRALTNDELQLYYQPKIDLLHSKSSGVEALLRWPHKEKGMIPPDVFIPLAEQGGLIKPLTYWVIDTALAQYSAWQKFGLTINIAVNLSAKNLDDSDLPNLLREKLEKWIVPPQNLVLEITETSIISDPAKALDVLTRLDDMGITLSIDDYGTGYSSLAYIKKLPVDEIKIDRSFVANINVNKDDAVIVKSTIDLAHSLGMRVVSEGVEDKETVEHLRALNCDYVQGYYYSRPLPVAETTAWFQQTSLNDK